MTERRPSPDEHRRSLGVIREHLELLAADSDTQNAWLHPCGWSRSEPFEHVKDHPPCAPVDELMQSFEDMWPRWGDVLQSVTTTELRAALDDVAAQFDGMSEDDYRDEIGTLDTDSWGELRDAARRAISAFDAAGTIESTS